MARDTLHTKCRLCKREGIKLFLKGSRCFSSKCPLEKKGAVVPGMHGLKRTSRLSAYGIQLRAKQKVKRFYGVLERQMHNYYLKAKNMPGLVGNNLLSLLETRLDNVLFVSGLSLSRTHAKQLISHKKVLVNGSVNNINSFQLSLSDVVSLKSGKHLKDLDIRANDKDFKAPTWLDLDKTKYNAKVIRLPQRDEIEKSFDENLIIEYYSR